MRFLRLVARFALRSKTRAGVTCLGAAMTLVTFIILRTVVASYSAQIGSMRGDRMEIRHKTSIFFRLYTAQAAKVSQLPGVRDVSWMCWFAGTYRDERHNFLQLAVEAESYLRLYPEYRPPEEQLKAWLADPAGVIVGDLLAKKNGWKLGDRIPIAGTIYPGDWSFTLRGIYSGNGVPVDRERLLLHWRYMNEKLPGGNHVARILVRVDDPSVGKRIDTFFENSATPTKTESELTLQRQWSSWSAGVVKAMDDASSLVLVVLGLVLANGLGMSISGSTREFAVLRAIGCSSRWIRLLILGEALAMGLCASAVALLLAPSVLRAATNILIAELGGAWSLELRGHLALLAAIAGPLISLLSGLWPALKAPRVRIIDAMRRAA
jgi:putative ABC transport system permease protein